MAIRRIEVDGARQIAAAMAQGRRSLGAGMGEPHGEAARTIFAAASGFVPRRSGTLAAGLFQTSNPAFGEAGVGGPVYAGVIHFGVLRTTGRPANIRPNKFVFAGFKSTEPKIYDDFEDWVIKHVKDPIDALP